MSFRSRPAVPAVPLDLPADLSFLLWQGVRPEPLIRAAALARREGTAGVDALLGHRLMDEDAYYRALARAVGARYLGARIEPGPLARFPHDALAGAVGLAGGGVAVAPRGAAAAAEAAEALGRHRPAWAYRPGPTPLQTLAAALVLLSLPPLAVAPTVVQLGLLTAFNLLLLAATTFRLAALAIEPAPAPEPARDDAALPVYTVLVALHREAAVVPALLRALAALDYPAAKLDLTIVIEEDDADTAAALAAARDLARFEVVVAPAGMPRTKPRALNVALPLARGEYLVVYDAEDAPDSGQLRSAAAAFAAAPRRTACLQGRLVIDNTDDSWLTRCFTLEYAALFDVLGPALSAWRLPVPLGGTTTHFRTEVLRALHGWDAWNVTEDADLGMRLALAGYQVGDLPLATLEEAPSTLRPWLRQRTRWMKGFLQTAITHGRHPGDNLRRLGPLGLLCAASLILGTVLSALVYPVLMTCAAWRFLTLPLDGSDPLASFTLGVSLVLFAAGLGAMLLPAALGCVRRGWWRLLPWVAVLPLYYGLVGVAAWLGVLELIRAPARWNKTEHGLARTSRSGALRRDISLASRPALRQ
ncbi:glycosyltransferase family 2 protein [Methylobacterium oryzihabitans]|uniref:Glycosyltransferase n=1 Tax=Methylobacterium oryzihabitans TaxID=2499852 RepID=A0A3S2W692_9HYPH|nr:glycosyltransferase family 2 protein [Methylobacterium oryzihabitans]RVU14668.1 glycosyltransferase [Methylobacterium oryzihabitans]